MSPLAAKGHSAIVSGKAVVMVQARCGHDDYYELAPGETLHLMGARFTLCTACSTRSASDPSDTQED